MPLSKKTQILEENVSSAVQPNQTAGTDYFTEEEETAILHSSQLEKEFYSNRDRDFPYLLFKIVNYDGVNSQMFFDESCASFGIPKSQRRFPIRRKKNASEKYRVTPQGPEVFDTKDPNRRKKFSSTQKQNKSKLTSFSVADLKQQYFPAIFDWGNSANLGGYVFQIKDPEENNDQVLIYHGIMSGLATYDRPEYADTLDVAHKKWEQLKEQNHFMDVKQLIQQGIRSPEKYNEVLVAAAWKLRHKGSGLIVAKNDLQNRLLQQLHAVNVKEYTGQLFIPISIYNPSNKTYVPYLLKEQEADIKEALSSTDPYVKSLAIIINMYNDQRNVFSLDSITDSVVLHECCKVLFSDQEISIQTRISLLTKMGVQITSEVKEQMILAQAYIAKLNSSPLSTKNKPKLLPEWVGSLAQENPNIIYHYWLSQINNISDIIDILEALPQQEKLNFINIVGIDFIKKMILSANPEQQANFFAKFMNVLQGDSIDNYISVFNQFGGLTFLKDIKSSLINILSIIKILPDNIIQHFLQTPELINLVKSKIYFNNAGHMALLIEMFQPPRSSVCPFMFFSAIINSDMVAHLDPCDLQDILTLIPADQRLIFIQHNIGIQFLANTDASARELIFSTINSEEKFFLLQQIQYNSLENIANQWQQQPLEKSSLHNENINTQNDDFNANMLRTSLSSKASQKKKPSTT